MATTVEVQRESRLVGKPLKRLEDPKFVTGAGKFLDDVTLPNMLYGAFVRSLHAHAKIVAVDDSEALKHPSVRLVLKGAEMVDEINKMETVDGEDAKATTRYPLAFDEVGFVGEPVALVIAEDRYDAEDAAELVRVDYEPLTPVVDPLKAVESGSPKVHDYLSDNIGYHFVKESGDIRSAFKKADHVVTLELVNQRLAAVPMEPRGVVASFDPASDALHVWLSTQTPHEARDTIAEVLKMPETNVRVISPDVGGGFGQKGSVYPEELAICFAATRVGQPVKWYESRLENLLAASHGRGQVQQVEAAVRKDGKILGLKVKIIADAGAYSAWESVKLPQVTVEMATGVYDIPAYRGELFSVLTNKTPQGAYRGAGRPEAAYLIERTVDRVARQLRLDPVKVRLLNFVPKSKFPYLTAGGFTYDSGDYEMNLRKALEVSEYEKLKKTQLEARSRGRLVGIGLATYVEVCGFSPNYPQTAAITVTSSGKVVVNVGTNPHGQGHITPFAQVVAQELGLDITDISIRYGDTATLPYGTITAGSRSAAVGGSACLLAARKVRRKMSAIAAKMMGLKDENLSFRNGRIQSASNPRASLSFEDVAGQAYHPTALPRGMEPTIYEYCAYAPSSNVFPFGTHIAMVEVDRETGLVKVLKYFAVDDVGNVLNPLIVEGQVQGGVLQGIAQALLERIVYDDNGQLLTSTLSEYLIPSTDTAPIIRCFRTETPSPANPLGAKGVGEAGTIAATPTIMNAVEDALSPFSATIAKMPLTPEYVLSLIEGSEGPSRQSST